MLRRIGPRRIRRALLVVSAALVAGAIFLAFSVQISETGNGAAELINGQPNTDALILPLVLFIVGGAGFLAALGWRPTERE